jgi:hypothetical protein
MLINCALITQDCSGKIVLKISTFLYRFLCAELKKKFYHVPLFHKINFSFQGVYVLDHYYIENWFHQA